MSHYSALIAVELGVSAEMAAVAEEFLRDGRSGLDGLAREQLVIEACAAVADVYAWRDAGEVGGMSLARYCDVMGLAVPAEVTA